MNQEYNCESTILCNDDKCKICFEKSFASHEKSKFWSIKNSLLPRYVFKKTTKKYWFNCVCGHEFEMMISDINRNRWCGYCSHQKLCDNLNCTMCFNNSFQSNSKSKYWSIKNQISPRNIFKSSNRKFYFNCECGHEFISSLNRIELDNSWCPYCTNQILCEDEKCKKCFEKSFASHEKSKFWSNSNKLKPRNIFKGTKDKFEFICVCGHTFLGIITNIVCLNRWCPYCTNQKLCNNDSCESCYKKSFASHEKSKYWSKSNILKPCEVFKSSGNKKKFVCENNHEFSSVLYAIINGNWCPYCKNKTEKKLYDKIRQVYPCIEFQCKKDWCKKKNFLPFDFVLENEKIIIELDGEQHFKQVSNWKDPKITQGNDILKMKLANSNGYSIIRLLQDDVYNDKFDWLLELKNNIEKIKNKNNITNIFICKNNEYEIYNNMN